MDRDWHGPGPDVIPIEPPLEIPVLGSTQISAADRAHFVRDRFPASGLFANQTFRISPNPFPLAPGLVEQIEMLGRILLQFNRAANLLYRQSVEGKQPRWIAEWLDRGKPSALIELQRAPAFKNALPRVIRPDLLLTESGLAITELDSVPGGIGLTAWLNQTYSQIPAASKPSAEAFAVAKPVPKPLGTPHASVLGGPDGMLTGFARLFDGTNQVHIVVSDESATYRPEMEWLARQLNSKRFHVRDSQFAEFANGDGVYRFFELFDLENVRNSKPLFELALQQKIRLTPPPKAFLEEKMWFALLWNRNLNSFWRQQLGQSFFDRLLQIVPYSWVIDPAPLPPHGAIPGLELTDWQQLKGLSQKERNLILKVSGFSETAWGARGVYLGSDLSVPDWTQAVDQALNAFDRSLYVLQRYHKPKTVHVQWFDFDQNTIVPMPGRVRLCPYYFVLGESESARAHLGGILATICPSDKKIIHGMKDAVLAPCSIART